MVTKEEIQGFIRAQVDREFFDELEVLIPQTFQKAAKEVEDLLIHTPRKTCEVICAIHLFRKPWLG